MRFKPKTVRRLLLLAVVLAGVIGLAFSLFFVRRWQTERQLASFKREGMEALAARDYRKSLASLGRYVQRGNRDDAEALLAFARARVALEEPDFSHLRDAVQAYQEYFAIRPDDRAERLEYLTLCNQAGDWVSARDAALQLRPASLEACSAEHVGVLREEAVALTAAHMAGERLDGVVSRLLELDPRDLQGRLIRLEVWGRMGKGEEARREALEFGQSNPDDPVAQFVSAVSVLVDPNGDDHEGRFRHAREGIALCLGLEPLDESRAAAAAAQGLGFVSRAVDVLDRVHAADLSLRLLKRWFASMEHAPVDRQEVGLIRTLARRLWQQGEFAECAEIAARFEITELDSEVLGFCAMSLQMIGEEPSRSRANAVVASLKTRQDDFRAVAWSDVIGLADPERTPAPLADIEALKAIVRATNRIEPVFLVMLGESFAALGRMEEAREQWRDAGRSPVCASWAVPHIRSAETLLAEGRPEDANPHATSALLIAHSSPAVNALWFECQAALVLKGVEKQVSPALVAGLDRVIEQVEGAPPSSEVRSILERLMVPRVLFLSRTGKREQAIGIVRRALDGPEPLDERTLQRLAAVGSSEGLGFERECLERAASGGTVSPAIDFARAMELAQRGNAESGLGILRNAAAGGAPEARLNLAKFLERTGHAGAAQAWVSLGDDFNSDLAIQQACLASSVVGSQPEFVERTIARYLTLSGREATAEDALVHVARARVLLHGSPSAKDRDDAVARLARVVGADPGAVEPRLLLARALLISNPARGIAPQEERAENLLTESLALQPRSVEVALELAMLLPRRGKAHRAVELLGGLANEPSAPVEVRRVAARLLVDLGGAPMRDGIAALEALAHNQEGKPPSAALLADLAHAYSVGQQPEKATATYELLIAHAAARPEHLLEAARYFQKAGNTASASKTIAEVGRMKVPPETFELFMARLRLDRDELDKAVAHFEEAVKIAPESVAAWRSFIEALLERGQSAAAVDVGSRAVAALPREPMLKVLLEQSRLAAAPNDANADLSPLIAALSVDPSMAGAAEIIRAVDGAAGRGELDQPQLLVELADRYPTVPVLQLFLARRLAPHDPDKAAALAGRARALAPGDPKVAKDAAEFFLLIGRWADMLAAATAWKEHAGGASAEPDVAIAQARLNLHDYRGGLNALKDCIGKAAADPDSPHALSILNMQARLLIASGREQEAKEMLEPLIQKSAQVRVAIWLRVAAEAMSNPSRALEWIERARTDIPSEATEEQLAVAGAWSVLATRFPGESEALLKQSREFLRDLNERTNSSQPAALEALGVICQRLGDIDAAQEAYQRAVALDGQRVICLNNLASILAEERSDPAAALPLAERAVSVMPDASSLSTLASIQSALAHADRKAGKGEALFKKAAESFRRMAKQRPRDSRAWSRAAEAMFEAGDYTESASAWERVLSLGGLSKEGIAVVRNNLANAMLRQDSGPERAQRAKDLVTEALATSENAAFRDTLGWAELALGQNSRAAEAFRASLSGGATDSATIGLALALASGGPEQQREAAQLATGIDAKGLDPYLASKLRGVLGLVQVDKP